MDISYLLASSQLGWREEVKVGFIVRRTGPNRPIISEEHQYWNTLYVSVSNMVMNHVQFEVELPFAIGREEDGICRLPKSEALHNGDNLLTEIIIVCRLNLAIFWNNAVPTVICRMHYLYLFDTNQQQLFLLLFKGKFVGHFSAFRTIFFFLTSNYFSLPD